MGTLEDAIVLAAGLAEKKRATREDSQNPSAAASAPAISQEEETVAMDPTTTHPQPNADAGGQSANKGTANVVTMEDVTKAASDAVEKVLADQDEVRALCKAWNRADLSEQFVKDRKTPEQAKDELMRMAANEDAVASTSNARTNLGPEAQAREATAFMDACKNQAKRSEAVGARGI
jgi:hypothetical protein